MNISCSLHLYLCNYITLGLQKGRAREWARLWGNNKKLDCQALVFDGQQRRQRNSSVWLKRRVGWLAPISPLLGEKITNFNNTKRHRWRRQQPASVTIEWNIITSSNNTKKHMQKLLSKIHIRGVFNNLVKSSKGFVNYNFGRYHWNFSLSILWEESQFCL